MVSKKIQKHVMMVILTMEMDEAHYVLSSQGGPEILAIHLYANSAVMVL